MTPEQQALDREYENGPFIPGAQAYADAWESESASFRKAHAGAYDVAYGDHPRTKYDLFSPDAPKGLFVFVHGGYWVSRAKEDWTCFAAGPFAAGWAVALPGYPLAPEVRISDITAQIAAAVTDLASKIDGPIILAGHSAGGHLVARMGQVLPQVVQARLQMIVPISPVSDLRRMIPLTMNEQFRLSPDEAVAESPVLHPAPNCPVKVIVGAEERPVFLDHARWLADSWGAQHQILPGRHHFDVIDGLKDAQSPLLRDVL